MLRQNQHMWIWHLKNHFSKIYQKAWNLNHLEHCTWRQPPAFSIGEEHFGRCFLLVVSEHNLCSCILWDKPGQPTFSEWSSSSFCSLTNWQVRPGWEDEQHLWFWKELSPTNVNKKLPWTDVHPTQPTQGGINVFCIICVRILYEKPWTVWSYAGFEIRVYITELVLHWSVEKFWHKFLVVGEQICHN